MRTETIAAIVLGMDVGVYGVARQLRWEDCRAAPAVVAPLAARCVAVMGG